VQIDRAAKRSDNKESGGTGECTQARQGVRLDGVGWDGMGYGYGVVDVMQPQGRRGKGKERRGKPWQTPEERGS
jgi:hypothetical protein